ncbi:YceI family protein [Rubrivivax albus]|uniref:Polyisoprenoid-binding protein n=1 Tax=Rubrivivax albus TaxID=2499835 RepID=A0A437JVR6_9BURK|nr:YceI family protein [Rubrivivax albus]RVT51389.1 polyisoprenoid-binding protein [Rubrivivax albus]
MTRTLKTFVAALAAAPLLAAAAPATYAIDPTHTSVFFEALHFGTSTNRGRFIKNSGTVVFDRAGKSGKVDLTLDMTGISTGVARFDGHLASADFFDVANHPTAGFSGDKFVFDGDKVTAVEGVLTLRGKTHPVTLKAVRFGCYDNPMLKREVCGGDFETTIKRSLWGVNWGLQMGVADDTKLIIQVEAIKQ